MQGPYYVFSRIGAGVAARRGADAYIEELSVAGRLSGTLFWEVSRRRYGTYSRVCGRVLGGRLWTAAP